MDAVHAHRLLPFGAMAVWRVLHGVGKINVI